MDRNKEKHETNKCSQVSIKPDPEIPDKEILYKQPVTNTTHATLDNTLTMLNIHTIQQVLDIKPSQINIAQESSDNTVVLKRNCPITDDTQEMSMQNHKETIIESALNTIQATSDGNSPMVDNIQEPLLAGEEVIEIRQPVVNTAKIMSNANLPQTKVQKTPNTNGILATNTVKTVKANQPVANSVQSLNTRPDVKDSPKKSPQNHQTNQVQQTNNDSMPVLVTTHAVTGSLNKLSNVAANSDLMAKERCPTSGDWSKPMQNSLVPLGITPILMKLPEIPDLHEPSKVGRKRKLSELRLESTCSRAKKLQKITERANAKKLAIAPVDYPITTMSKHEIRLLKSSLLAAIDNIANNETFPRFLSCHRNNGSLEISCFDDPTFQWLKKVTGTLTISPGIKLKAVEPWILHKMTRFVVHVPGMIEKPETILFRLQHQNKGLSTEGWVVKQCTEMNVGQTMVIAMKEDGVKALEELHFEPFVNFSRLKFKKVTEDSEDPSKGN